MPRGKHNKQNNHRGRGGGHGGGRGRGRGRGGPRGGGNPNTVLPATPAANRPPRHPYPNPNAEIDVVIQQWVEPGASRGIMMFTPKISSMWDNALILNMIYPYRRHRGREWE